MLRRIVTLIISFIKSIWFNIRYLPLHDAYKLPILIAPNVKVKNMWKGGIVLHNTNFGILHIGFHEADAVDTYSTNTIIDVERGGTIECKNDIHIGHGAILCVKKNAKLELGENFAISGTTKIVCSEKIVIGANVQFSWNTLVMDSDAHFIFDINMKPFQNKRSIFIGNNVWIAANNVILKGTVICDNCVVGINSLLNKEFKTNNALIAGNPAKLIKHIGGWSL